MKRRIKFVPVAALAMATAVSVSACGSQATPSGSATSTTRPAASSPAEAPAPSAAPSGPAFVGPFAPIVLKGKGDKVVAFEIPDDAIAIASMSHPGGGGFEVQTLDDAGKETQVLVKTTGKYKGVSIFDIVEHSVGFKVSAKGAWKITVKPTEAAKSWDGTSTIKGRGNMVLRLATPSAAGAKLELTATGKGRFAFRAHSPDDEVYLVETAGPYKGKVELPEETELLEIRTKGAWAITPAP